MKCFCVIVTYNPDQNRLNQALSSLLQNNLEIIIVDNSINSEKTKSVLNNFHNNTNLSLVPLYKNYGIAYAQNVGIELALKGNPSFILLSDQDTTYDNNYLDRLLNEYYDIFLQDNSIGAIGPCYLDENKPEKKPFFVQYNNGKLTQIANSSGTIPVSQLIASGTLISTNALRKVGMMNSDLFIDWVDMEWCWRAIRSGFSIYGTFNVKINHQLGDNSKKIGKKTITIHSPFRNYFIVRNGIHLALRGPLLDKKKHMWHLLKNISLFYFGMLYLSENKWQDFKHMSKGIYNGLRGKLGPLA